MHRSLNLQFKIYSNHAESMGDEEWGGELLRKKEKHLIHDSIKKQENTQG